MDRGQPVTAERAERAKTEQLEPSIGQSRTEVRSVRRDREWKLFLDLCAPLSHEIEELPTDDEWRGMLSRLEQTRFGALAYHNLRARGLEDAVPAQVMAHLRAEHAQALARYHLLGEMVSPHLEALQREVDFLVLKGTAWAHTVYPEPHLRQSGDIDLLVKEEDQAAAVEHLRESGWDIEGRAGQAGHGPKASRRESGLGTTCLELHTDLVPYREAWPVPSLRAVWDTGTRAHIWGTQHRVCAPAIAMLHSATKAVMDLPGGHHRYVVDTAHIRAHEADTSKEAWKLAVACGARGVLWATCALAESQAWPRHAPHLSARIGYSLAWHQHVGWLWWGESRRASLFIWGSRVAGMLLSDRLSLRAARIAGYVRRRM